MRLEDKTTKGGGGFEDRRIERQKNLRTRVPKDQTEIRGCPERTWDSEGLEVKGLSS